jgi:hypothetical protein
MALQKRLRRQVEAEVRRLRARERQRRDQRVDPPLAAGELRPGRHLGPIELQHLPRPITRPLRRPHLTRAELRQALLDEVDRPLIAIVGPEDLRHARRLDLRPLLQQLPQHRLERIEHRPLRRPRIARRLRRLDQPVHRAPIDPQPRCDLPLRDPIRGQRPHLRPLHRAAHLLALLGRRRRDRERQTPTPRPATPDRGAVFDYRKWRTIGPPASRPMLGRLVSRACAGIRSFRSAFPLVRQRPGLAVATSSTSSTSSRGSTRRRRSRRLVFPLSSPRPRRTTSHRTAKRPKPA